MKKVALTFFLAATALASDVIEATDKNFDDVIKGDFVLMKFYAPWCGHCKKMAPEYEVAATELKGIAQLAKLDATVDKATPEKYEVKGFPTIKIFRDGELTGDYEGGRTAKEIVSYIKSHTGPAVATLEDVAGFDQFKKENPTVFLQVGDVADSFTAVAKKKRGVAAFAQAAPSVVGMSEGVYVVKADEETVVFKGELGEDTFSKFVDEESVAIFDEMGPQNYKRYIDRKLPIAWLFTPTSNDEVKTACRTAAGSFKGQLSFVWVDSDKYGGMAERLGLPGDKFPGFVIDNEGKHFAFPKDKALTSESVADFASNYVAGTLEATVRSEAVPEEHTVDGLTTIVGKTFGPLVSEADVDVLIEFYAPWCGHCKQLAPVYAKVAETFEKDSIRIAQIDATANDFDQSKFNVQGFPTIFFVSKDTHEPVAYEGGRSEEDLTAFLKSKL